MKVVKIKFKGRELNFTATSAMPLGRSTGEDLSDRSALTEETPGPGASEERLSSRPGPRNPCLVPTYERVLGEIPLSLKRGTFISVDREPALKISAIGFQPAKSIPELARWFLQKYCDKSALILDPFCGSGTTLVETLRYGASIRWLDYNPLSRLICAVKTQNVDFHRLVEETNRILLLSERQKAAQQTISFANKDFWFQKPVQEALEILREHISNAEPRVRNVLWLCLASTVRKMSDMNDGMLLAAKRSHIEEIPRRSRTDVFNAFGSYVQKATRAIREWQELCGDRFHLAKELAITDANGLHTQCDDLKFDAVVTSPPYINAIDYVWASKFELHWLGLVKDDADRLALYSKEIGTERIAKEEVRELGRTGHLLLDGLLEEIYTGKRYQATTSQNRLRSRVTYKYFADMKRHFETCFRSINPGGYYCFTIGDRSKICGVDVPVAGLLAEFAEEAGFRKIFEFHVLLRNRKLNVPRNVAWAGTIKHDTTVVLRKPSPN